MSATPTETPGVKAAPDRLDRETQLALMERLLLIRRFEEAIITLAPEHDSIGRQHLSIGHEPTGAACGLLLRDGDISNSTHRNHGHVIGRGADPARMLAEILGRADGYNRGRGGTWHPSVPECGFLATSAMVGGSIGLGVGAGYAVMKTHPGAVSVCHFGDGVLDEGVAYEALNLASLYKLPVLFLCENNNKVGQPPHSMVMAKQLVDIPAALDIPTAKVDGADAGAVYDAAADALGTLRNGGGPVFVEVFVERWPGAHQNRPESVTGLTDIRQAWDEDTIEGPHADWVRRFDPVRLYARHLVTECGIDKDALTALDDRVRKSMAKAAEAAAASPWPGEADALTGAYA